MAALTGRWSRWAARARWVEVGDLMRTPLPVAIVVTAIWPISGMLLYWSVYRNPAVAAAVLIAAVALPLALCVRGPLGIGPVLSLLSCGAAVGLTWVLGLQLEDPFPSGALWMNSWGMAAAVVLAFARPAEEPLALAAGVLLVTALVAPSPFTDPQVLHVAPMAIGAAVPATVCAVALASALRAGVLSARAVRAAADAAEQQLAVAQAVHVERELRFARWEEAIVPLLEAVAAGRRDPADPDVARECAQLSRMLRAQLSTAAESLFEALLEQAGARLRCRGGDLVVRDLDVGYRLREVGRVLLTHRITEICDADGAGTVQLTLLAAESGEHATAIVSVEGLPVPATPGWSAHGGALTVEHPLRWWWDAELELDPAPALRSYGSGAAPGTGNAQAADDRPAIGR